MNGFINEDALFTDQPELSSDAFNLGEAEWNSMLSAPYDEAPAINSTDTLFVKGENNQTSNHDFLLANSPHDYNPSSGVSSPGLSDHNMDTLSSTSLEDRNEFESLINYDGESNTEVNDCLSKSFWIPFVAIICSCFNQL